METCCRVAAKFLAMVHLGYIPDDYKRGLCLNLRKHLRGEGFDYDQVAYITKELKGYFEYAGLHTDYPIEGSSHGYASSGHKYRGIVGVKRRALAKALAVHLKEFESKDTFKT